MLKIFRLAFALITVPSLILADQLSGDSWSEYHSADVILIGEVHDNPHHHKTQARAVAALQPAAIVFEMLSPEHAASVTSQNRKDADVLAMVFEWEARGWPDFSMYYPIFEAAPDAAIFGADLLKDDVRRATKSGAAAVFGDGAAIFALDQPYGDKIQAALEDEQMVAHCDALPPEMLPGMVEAQRLRDAALARAILAAVYESRARSALSPVVVITGNGHARRDFAVPALLAMLPEALSVITVGQFETAPSEPPDFDHWIVTEGVARADPCEAFK